jgi:hypothetical protein
MINFDSQIQNISDNIKSNISEFLISCIKNVGLLIIDSSDVICPIICLLALAFYIGGNRKSGKYISGSVISYFLLQALKGVIIK